MIPSEFAAGFTAINNRVAEGKITDVVIVYKQDGVWYGSHSVNDVSGALGSLIIRQEIILEFGVAFAKSPASTGVISGEESADK